jgi:hypothetical protein
VVDGPFSSSDTNFDDGSPIGSSKGASGTESPTAAASPPPPLVTEPRMRL